MSNATVFDRTGSLSDYVRTITWINGLFAVQLAVGLTYAVLVGAVVPNFRYYLIPFIWITIGALAMYPAGSNGLKTAISRS